jgi:hypothetical protein
MHFDLNAGILLTLPRKNNLLLHFAFQSSGLGQAGGGT